MTLIEADNCTGLDPDVVAFHHLFVGSLYRRNGEITANILDGIKAEVNAVMGGDKEAISQIELTVDECVTGLEQAIIEAAEDGFDGPPVSEAELEELRTIARTETF